MTSPKDKLLRQLDACIADKATEDLVIAQTFALLEKVDQRRREHPRDRRRWDVRADDLEVSLLESKRRHTFFAQRILDLTRKIESGSFSLEEEGETAEEPMVPELPDTDTVEAAERASRQPTLGHANAQAAQRMLDLPLFKLQHAPLEDFILAKLYLESKDSIELSREKREDLVKRVKIYDRSADRRRQTKHRDDSPRERREQLLLRAALDKCTKKQVGTLTLDEINMVVGCYDILLQRGHEHSPDDRLVGIVNDAIDKICATWANMDGLKRHLKDGGAEEHA